MNPLARILFALALLIGTGLVAPARAQEEVVVEGEEEGEGDPLMGYMGTGALACAAMFILCKSARR